MCSSVCATVQFDGALTNSVVIMLPAVFSGYDSSPVMVARVASSRPARISERAGSSSSCTVSAATSADIPDSRVVAMPARQRLDDLGAEIELGLVEDPDRDVVG